MSGKTVAVALVAAFLVTGCGGSSGDARAAHDGTGNNVQPGARASALPQPVAGQQLVNDLADWRQREPDIVALPGGRYIGAWRWESGTAEPDGDLDAVLGRPLDETAAPAAPTLVLNAEGITDGNQIQPAVAATADGFIAVWSSEGAQGGGGSLADRGVFGQRFSAGGMPEGDAFRIDEPEHVGPTEAMPDIAVAPDGSFVVSWVTRRRPISEASVLFRRFAADGEPLGPSKRAGGLGLLPQAQPRIAMGPEGDFAIAWNTFREYRTTGGPPPPDVPLPLPDAESRYYATISDIRLRCYTDEGRSRSLLARTADSALRLEKDGGTYLRRPALARVGDRWIIAWSHVDVIEDREVLDPHVPARAYHADCRADGGRFSIADTGSTPDIAALAGGGFLASWAVEAQDGEGRHIFARRFEGPDAPPGEAVRVNDASPEPFGQGAHPSFVSRVAAGQAPGSFAVIWEGAAPPDGHGIYARAFVVGD